MTQRERQILQWIEADPMISQEALAERAGITRSSVAVHISNLMKKGYIAGKGYVLRSGTYAAVVGGVNVDIGGQSYAPLVARDSNPGRVRISLGGVGRNIAHNMSLLGVDVRLLTAFGDDLHAQRVAASCGELGIVNGVGNNKFEPDSNITREQMAAILFRYAAMSGFDTSARGNLDQYPDRGDVSGYAVEPLSWAVAEGLIKGTDNGNGILLDPQGNATRAQVATIIMRFIRTAAGK